MQKTITPLFLVVSNFKTDTIFRIFSKPGCNYLGWFGMNGKGSCEFLMIGFSGLRFYCNQLQVADFSFVENSR